MQIKEAEVNEIILLKLGWTKVPVEPTEGVNHPECPNGWGWLDPKGIIYPGTMKIPNFYYSKQLMLEVLSTLNVEQFKEFILYIKPGSPTIWTAERVMQFAFFLDSKEAAKAFLKLFDVDVVEG